MRPSVCCFDPQGGLNSEVLDDSGQPRPGYLAAACPDLATDSHDHIVRWSGRDLVQGTAAEKDLGGEKLLFEYQLRRPLRLRFHLDRAKLFSFWVD